MSDYLTLQNVVMVGGALVVLILLMAWIRVMDDDENDLKWVDLVSTKGSDGLQHADWDKIGKGCAIVLCVLATIVYAYSPGMDATGLALLLGVVLAYLGGVSGYAATLRARQGTVTTTTEPVPPEGEKKTIVETPPVKAKGKAK